eukprot:1269320-Amorphochlora_amoeboformis.AAC.3
MGECLGVEPGVRYDPMNSMRIVDIRRLKPIESVDIQTIALNRTWFGENISCCFNRSGLPFPEGKSNIDS